jgi:hypothetical protein
MYQALGECFTVGERSGEREIAAAAIAPDGSGLTESEKESIPWWLLILSVVGAVIAVRKR